MRDTLLKKLNAGGDLVDNKLCIPVKKENTVVCHQLMNN